jgi:Protein of unknown function (DUF2934)
MEAIGSSYEQQWRRDSMNSKQTPASKSERSPNSGSARVDTSQPGKTEDSAEARRRRTAIAAFYRAQARGFAPGRELEDWLEAEREIDALDASRSETATPQSSVPADDRMQVDDRAMRARSDGITKRGTSKRGNSKRTKTTRGASLQARNRGDES